MKNQLDIKQSELQSIDIKNWVTKSNELIESTYKLSLQEQRILLVMASKVQPSDETLKTYSFRARDFIEIIGNKKGTGFYSYLKEIVKGLQTKVLTIKKNGQERDYSWVITSIYEKNEGYITLQFHPDLKDLFLELKEKFTTYQLENVVRLNSVYSIRIYELLKQYERLKKRQLTMLELRSLLGIEPTKYKQYGHFKNKVLLVAQTEINQKTDINFELNEIKTGRKVTSIEFKINGNSNKEVKVITEPKLEKTLESEEPNLFTMTQNEDVLEIQEIGLTLGLKLSEKLIKEWLKYPKENIIDLMNMIKYKDDIKNPIGYISTVLPKQAQEKKEITDPIQKAIRDLIKKYIPSQKVSRLDSLPDFIIKESAMKEFIKLMDVDQAENVWRENREQITSEINEQRRKMQFS
ncbi:replication initiation protein (plasmid) [Pseudalkalibacillus hwajinpoensis]|uniref:replication initiation protein n=1 Tax=Guptibacillus hwajinpoensis TaxID=208199 RepID=UPI00325B93B6